MTWTYSSPADYDRDKVRFLIGDTDTNDQILSDEEIAYLLDTYNDDTTLAAAYACDAIVAKYSRQADFSNMSLSVSASQRAAAYGAKAAQLHRQAGLVARPFFGGLTVSGKDSLSDDSDAVQPAFSVGMHDRDTSSDDGD